MTAGNSWKRRGGLWIECCNCAKPYSVRQTGGACPVCGFDPFPGLLHALDPLALSVRLFRNSVDSKSPSAPERDEDAMEPRRNFRAGKPSIRPKPEA